MQDDAQPDRGSVLVGGPSTHGTRHGDAGHGTRGRGSVFRSLFPFRFRFFFFSASLFLLFVIFPAPSWLEELVFGRIVASVLLV